VPGEAAAPGRAGSVSVLDCTLMRLETGAGVTGRGEVVPLGPFYLPAHPRAAVRVERTDSIQRLRRTDTRSRAPPAAAWDRGT
jgi:hypothetical protein